MSGQRWFWALWRDGFAVGIAMATDADLPSMAAVRRRDRSGWCGDPASRADRNRLRRMAHEEGSAWFVAAKCRCARP